MATVAFDIDQWDTCASAAGATSTASSGASSTRLAQRMGRIGVDDVIDLTMPVNDRVEGDTRANAITNVDFALQPPAVTTDLRGVRSNIKQALIRHQEEPNPRSSPAEVVRKLESDESIAVCITGYSLK